MEQQLLLLPLLLLQLLWWRRLRRLRLQLRLRRRSRRQYARLGGCGKKKLDFSRFDDFSDLLIFSMFFEVC